MVHPALDDGAAIIVVPTPADEPTAALDKASALNVVHLLERLGRERGTTTLMVTHDTKIIDLADRIVTLEDGRNVRDENLAG
jgi:putative ABC transport system ATP-binding protein